MHPSLATCRPAPASRPPALALVEPRYLADPAQPALPLALTPDLVVEDSTLDPELQQLATSLISALIEVLSGQRSALQLERWVEPEVLNLVEHLRRGHRGQRWLLRSVRVQAPHSEAVEVSAHLAQGGTSRAAAMRMRLRRGQWVVTHLMIALRPQVVHRAG